MWRRKRTREEGEGWRTVEENRQVMMSLTVACSMAARIGYAGKKMTRFKTYLVASVTVVAVVKCALLGVLAVDHIVVGGGGGLLTYRHRVYPG
jgi:hypothetical protein